MVFYRITSELMMVLSKKARTRSRRGSGLVFIESTEKEK